MAEWLAIFLLNLNIKEGVSSRMLRRITGLFFPRCLETALTVLSSTGRSIQEEMKPETD